MATSKNNDMYSYLDQLSTQELEDLLRKDMEAADGGDLDMVMYIMEVIEKREGGISAADKKAAAQALEEFFNSYATPEGDGLQLYPCDIPDCTALNPNPIDFTHRTRHTRFSLRKALLLAAALICLSSLIVCTALGFERVFQMVGKWTSEVFTFENQYTGDMPEENNNPENLPPEDAQYATIEEALDAYGITEKVVPLIPSKLKLSCIDIVTTSSNRIEFFASYSDSEQYLIFEVIKFNTPSSDSFEKDSVPVKELIHNGITYYLFQNVNSNCATWFNNDLQCSIDTNLPINDLITIINSI